MQFIMPYPSLKLTYFPIAGRAEVTRLTLHVGDVLFEDERIPREEFAKRKATLPFKQLPVLTVNGEVMAQSEAMARYAGKLCGLYPVNDPLSAFRVDEILGALEDIRNKIFAVHGEQDQEKKLALEKDLADNILPGLFATLEARLATKSNGPFLLETISIADIAIFSFVRKLLKNDHIGGIPSIDGYATINAIYNAVGENPKVKEWYEKN